MTNPDNAGGLIWYVCTSCMLMVQLPSDTPTLGRCQCSPKGWSLRRAKLPKGYELCRAAPAGSGEVSESVVIGYRCPRCKWSGREIDTNYGHNGWGRYCPRCPKSQHCYPTQDAALLRKLSKGESNG